MLGLGLSSWQAAARLRAGPQAILGAALLGWWDAARTDRIVLAGSNVTSWADLVNGITLSQATSGYKPLWSASAVGGRPGVTFDGTDDFLTAAADPFPLGAAPSELWIVASSTAPASDAAARVAFGYGSPATTAARRFRRSVVAGASRMQASLGGGGPIDASVDFIGAHVARMAVGATGTAISIDGATATSAAIVPDTTAGYVTMGATTGTSPTGLWLGSIAAALVTAPLSDAQAAMLLRWCKDRGGIA